MNLWFIENNARFLPEEEEREGRWAQRRVVARAEKGERDSSTLERAHQVEFYKEQKPAWAHLEHSREKGDLQDRACMVALGRLATNPIMLSLSKKLHTQPWDWNLVPSAHRESGENSKGLGTRNEWIKVGRYRWWIRILSDVLLEVRSPGLHRISGWVE